MRSLSTHLLEAMGERTQAVRGLGDIVEAVGIAEVGRKEMEGDEEGEKEGPKVRIGVLEEKYCFVRNNVVCKNGEK